MKKTMTQELCWTCEPNKYISEYTKNGWTVFSDGESWKIINAKGHRYARTYKVLANAIKFAESKMSEKSNG